MRPCSASYGNSFAVPLPYGIQAVARTLRDPKLDTRSARTRLPTRREPYWAKLGPGLHLGYRRTGREGGTWIARAYDPGMRQRAHRSLAAADDILDADRVGVMSFAQAQEAARGWFPVAFQAVEKTTAQTAIKTVGDAVGAYLGWLDTYGKASTAREARYAANAHILPALGSVRLDRLTAARLASWLAALASAPRRVRGRKGGGVTPTRPTANDADAQRARKSSANRVRTILVAALNRAFHEGHVASDAAWRKAKPFRGADAAREHWLTVAEATRLINACPPDFRRLVQGALLTGCRYGELVRLEVGDFDASAATVHIRDSKAGKPRRVPLDDEGLAFFRAVTAGRSRSEKLFRRADGEAWGKSWQVRPMAEASAAARLDTAASFHTLRHTYASLRVRAGMPLPVVAAVLGHTTTRMVERHYGHLAPSWVHEQVRATALGFGAGDEVKVTSLTPALTHPAAAAS